MVTKSLFVKALVLLVLGFAITGCSDLLDALYNPYQSFP